MNTPSNTFLLLCIVTISQSHERICPEEEGVFYSTSSDCLMYYHCKHQILRTVTCSPWQRFDIHSMTCKTSDEVDCNPEYSNIWKQIIRSPNEEKLTDKETMSGESLSEKELVQVYLGNGDLQDINVLQNNGIISTTGEIPSLGRIVGAVPGWYPFIGGLIGYPGLSVTPGTRQFTTTSLIPEEGILVPGTLSTSHLRPGAGIVDDIFEIKAISLSPIPGLMIKHIKSKLTKEDMYVRKEEITDDNVSKKAKFNNLFIETVGITKYEQSQDIKVADLEGPNSEEDDILLLSSKEGNKVISLFNDGNTLRTKNIEIHKTNLENGITNGYSNWNRDVKKLFKIKKGYKTMENIKKISLKRTNIIKFKNQFKDAPSGVRQFKDSVMNLNDKFREDFNIMKSLFVANNLKEDNHIKGLAGSRLKRQTESTAGEWYWCGSGRYVFIEDNEDPSSVCLQLEDPEYINRETTGSQSSSDYAGHTFLGSNMYGW